VISAVFFIASVGAVVRFGLKLGGQGPERWMASLVTLDLIAIVPAAVLITLIALFPAKGKRYWQRFWARAPFVFVLTTGVALAFSTMPFWYATLMGVEQLTDTDLNTVGTAPEGDCDNLRNGVFQNRGMRIEREGNRQVQHDKVLGTTDTLIVSWPSPCEYELRKPGDQRIMHVKITHVDQKGYNCAFNQTGTDRLVLSVRLDRVK
jgi:hypothetical protein